MPRIYCTKKLESFIGNADQDLPSDMIYRSLQDWNAHLFFADRKKCLVFVNNRTAYSLFLADILKKDLKNIDLLFHRRLFEQLKHDNILNTDEAFKSIFPPEELKFYKTNNDRKTIGRINDFVNMFKVHLFYKYDKFENMNIIYENGLINTAPTGIPGEMKKTWSSPIENMTNETQR